MAKGVILQWIRSALSAVDNISSFEDDQVLFCNRSEVLFGRCSNVLFYRRSEVLFPKVIISPLLKMIRCSFAFDQRCSCRSLEVSAKGENNFS